MYWTGRVVDVGVGEARSAGLVELDRARGDVVQVVDWGAGWLWCRSLGGTFGWVPGDSVEFTEQAPPVPQ